MKRDIITSSLSLLIALPINTALNIKSGKPLSAVSPGIDAYCVAQVGRNPTLLGRVTTYHDLSAAVGGHFSELLPEKHEGILVLQRKVGSRIGMNEKVRLRFMERKAPLNKFPMLGESLQSIPAMLMKTVIF